VGILFFNWYGYQLLTQYWQERADSKLQARLDRNEYADDQLVSVKIPTTSISYSNINNSATGTFERVDGQIDVHGVRYQYVKRRITGDAIELLCIPNETAVKLQQVKNDFFRQANDLQQQNQGKKTPGSPVKHLTNDYQPTAMHVAVPGAPAVQLPAAGVYTCPDLAANFYPTAEMPPDASILA